MLLIQKKRRQKVRRSNTKSMSMENASGFIGIYIDEWANEGIRNKFTIECGAVKIHTLDFIGAYKLNTLNWICAKVGEREKSLHDLYFIYHAGITTDQLIKNVKLLNINFDPENCLEGLPKRFCENIPDQEMVLFVKLFECEIQNSLNRYNN